MTGVRFNLLMGDIMNKRILVLGLLVVLLLPGTLAAQGGLDSSQDPYFGAIFLKGGFLPDPYIVPMPIGSGDIDVSQLNLGPGCRGFVLTTPRSPDRIHRTIFTSAYLFCRFRAIRRWWSSSRTALISAMTMAGSGLIR